MDKEMALAQQEQGQFFCDGCTLVPLSQLDLEAPLGGSEAALEARGFVIILDDIGRPAIVRSAARQLHREKAERASRLAEMAARRNAVLAARYPLPTDGGLPRVEGMSPYESLVAAGKVVSPEKEFGGRPRPNFLKEELAASQAANELKKEMATAKAKARLEDQMRDDLGGRGKR